jgi:polyphenol oxidase
MKRKEKEGVKWLEFEQLTQFSNLKHGIFLRHGGFSQNDLSSLNVGSNVGDCPLNVKENLDKISRLLNIHSLINPDQVHGNTVAEIKGDPFSLHPPVDALITREKNIGLLIKHADCQAAIFYDPVHHVLANVHCGWRGSVQNIYRKTINYFKKFYNSSPHNILVCISPSLGPENSEFIHYSNELPEHFWQFQHKPNFFNFWQISKMQLKEEGILSKNIEIAEIDTYSNPADFFSYRRSKLSGRNGTVAALL